MRPVIRIEPDQQPPRPFDNRPFDHRRVGGHPRNRFRPINICLVGIAQFPERRPRTVEQRFPADRIGPAVQRRRINPGFLIIMKRISHARRIEPDPRFLHRVAVGNAENGNRHRNQPLPAAFPENQTAITPTAMMNSGKMTADPPIVVSSGVARNVQPN